MNIGRPRKLEPEAILEIATDIFWTKGFEATSIADILKATGLHKGSLYQTFGDKKTLFIACLTCYQEEMFYKVSKTIKSADNPIAGLKLALHEMVEETYTNDECSNKGCMAVNTLVETAPHDDEICMVLKSNEHRFQEFMIATLTKAQDEFNHTLRFPPDITFGLMMTFMCGLNSVSKNMIDKQQSIQLLDAQLQMLML